MKTTVLSLAILSFGLASAQFRVNIEAPDSFDKAPATVYTISGSRDISIGEMTKKNGKWSMNIPQQYRGIMRAYFPTAGRSVHFISENKDVDIRLNTSGNHITKTNFVDDANKVWKQVYDNQQKQDRILPALVQIKQLYGDGSDFDKALASEISAIQSAQNISLSQYPFIKFYRDNNKYSSGMQDPNSRLSTDDYVSFLVNSNEYLETSSLLRNTILNYMGTLSRENLTSEVDALLAKAKLNTSRGQNILSEMLSIFEAYGLKEEHDKYFQVASNLKGNISPSLKENLDAVRRNAIGATFTNYTFTKTAKNTKAKSIKDIKAKKKVVLFWSSTCPHCTAELPIIAENYKKLKAQNIEVIGLSLDSEAQNYENAVAKLPWVNDTKLGGWSSVYSEIYNVRATPTYYVLDSNNKIIEKPTNFSEFLSSNNIK